MNKHREYMKFLTQRQEELLRHDKTGLVALLLNLESTYLYEVYVRGELGDADCEEDRSDILSELNDFIRYQRIKEHVDSRIHRDFQSVDPSIRDELVRTLTELVAEVSDSV